MVQDKGKLVHAHPANELTEKLFGFESVIIKKKEVDATAAAFAIVSDVVPPGKIWKITYLSALNLDGDIATSFSFHVIHDDLSTRLHWEVGSTARYVTIEKSLELYLDAGDYVDAYFEGVTIGETCYLYIYGYEMNAP